jgi:hypothetical protein
METGKDQLSVSSRRESQSQSPAYANLVVAFRIFVAGLAGGGLATSTTGCSAPARLTPGEVIAAEADAEFRSQNGVDSEFRKRQMQWETEKTNLNQGVVTTWVGEQNTLLRARQNETARRNKALEDERTAIDGTGAGDSGLPGFDPAAVFSGPGPVAPAGGGGGVW